MVDFLGEDDLDLLTVTDTRVAVCLVLDASGSMTFITDETGMVFTGETGIVDGVEVNFVTGGKMRIDELNEGIRAFYDAIKKDDVAINSCELGIVTFNDTAKVKKDFALVGNEEPPLLNEARGETNLDAGVMLALELLEARKRKYKEVGRSYYQPWLVIMTDGAATTDCSRSQAKVKALEAQGKLTVFALSIAEGDSDEERAKMQSVLSGYSNKRKPRRIKDGHFEQFFEWLSASIKVVSQSKPGDKTTLPKPEDDFFDVVM